MSRYVEKEIGKHGKDTDPAKAGLAQSIAQLLRTWHQLYDPIELPTQVSTTTRRVEKPTKTKRRLLKRLSEKNLPSYLGYLSHANTYQLTQKLKNHNYSSGTSANSKPCFG